ncbi:M56 family metallopeptidase [Mesobacillus foraminis]|nr:M56 family metallopeptidase [Mesobacillus foraminis]
MWWRRKSWYLLLLSLVLASIVWIQMGMFLTHLIFGVNLELNFFKFCISLFRENSFYYFLVIFLLNTMIAYILLVTIGKVIVQIFLSCQFRSRLINLKDNEMTRLYGIKLNRHEDLMIIKSDRILAFTTGIKNPVIVLSTSLVQMLEMEELEAVVEHETFHKNNRDPLKIFILHVIAQSLWFIPLTKWCYENFKIMSELMADEYAVTKMGSEMSLGSALLKLIKNSFKTPSTLVVQFSGESVNFRLQQLVEPQKAIPVKLKLFHIAISIHVMLLLMGMVLFTLA